MEASDSLVTHFTWQTRITAYHIPRLNKPNFYRDKPLPFLLTVDSWQKESSRLEYCYIFEMERIRQICISFQPES